MDRNPITLQHFRNLFLHFYQIIMRSSSDGYVTYFVTALLLNVPFFLLLFLTSNIVHLTLDFMVRFSCKGEANRTVKINSIPGNLSKCVCVCSVFLA